MTITPLSIEEMVITPLPHKARGHWINQTHTSGCGITFVSYECSCCHKHVNETYPFCPYCREPMYYTNTFIAKSSAKHRTRLIPFLLSLKNKFCALCKRER